MNQDITVDLKKSQEAIEIMHLYRKRKYRNGNENMYKVAKNQSSSWAFLERNKSKCSLDKGSQKQKGAQVDK